MTPEDRSNQTAVASGNGIHIGTSCLATTHAFDPVQRHAEASRLAACWNACKGIQVSELERIASTGGMLGPREDVARIAAERDELLAALSRLSDAAARRENIMGDPCSPLSAKAELSEANRQAIATMKKAIGGAA